MSAIGHVTRIDPDMVIRDGIKELAPYIPGKPIREVQREYGLQEVIKLASNESPMGPPEPVIQSVLEEAPSLFRYPDGHCRELRERLAESMGVPPECFLFGNGGEECIRMIPQAFLNEGDVGLVPTPTFDAYETATRLVGGKVIRVPLRDFHIDLDAFLEYVNERTKIIWLCSPNNPTGTLLYKGELDRFLERLPDNKIVVLDQAYREYVAQADGADAIPYLQRDGRVIGIGTFSKAFALAGLRIGYLLAHPSLIEVLVKVKLPFNVNTLAQVAALKALEQEEFVARHIRMVREERDFLRDELNARGLFSVKSESNFLFVRLPLDAGILFRLLLPRGIIIRPGSAFGSPEFMRLSVGTREQNVRFLESLDEVLANPET